MINLRQIKSVATVVIEQSNQRPRKKEIKIVQKRGRNVQRVTLRDQDLRQVNSKNLALIQKTRRRNKNHAGAILLVNRSLGQMLRLLCLFILGIFVVSCDEVSVYSSYETINGGWDKQEPVSFELANMDTIAPFNAFITMRVNHEYSYNNLFLITRLGYPNGKVETDTLEYRMAEPSGALLGKGAGDVKENKLWYKEGLRFRESGTYTFTIEQAMRANGNVAADQKLKGITEIGLRIERQVE